jgi:hypothetical protein
VTFDAGLEWDPDMIRDDIRLARQRRLRERVVAGR